MRFLAEWTGPLHGLLIGFNILQGVRLALRLGKAPGELRRAEATRAWLPLSCRIASILISAVVLASAGRNDGPAAVAGAGAIALALALVAPLAGRRAPRRLAVALERTRLAWPAALAGHAAAGAAVVVAYLWISPSPLAGQLAGGGLVWGLVDKRWVVASYTLAVGIVVVLPIFLRRVFELVGLEPESPTCGPAEPRERSGAFRLAARSAGCLALSAALATWFFGETFTKTARPILDLHELVHLGSLHGIDQGLVPYLEAQTQYGPGHQLSTYRMMENIGFSLKGFRVSHLLANLAAMTLLYFCYLMSFPWRIALGMIAVSLWISPAVYFEFYGWAVIPRWLGPVVTGLLLPTLLLHRRSATARRPASALLGAFGGLTAWYASENLSGSVITFVLTSILCWSIRAVSTRAILEIAAAWLAGLASALAACFLSVFEPGQLARVAELYFRTSRLVTNGASNSGWGRSWDTWAWPYFLTPYLLVAAALATIYLPELAGTDRRYQRDRIRLVGLLAAAVVLHMVSLFRTDTYHLVVTTMALGAVVVLACFRIPELAARRPGTRRRIRAGIVAGVLLIYPVVDLAEGLRRRLPFHAADAAAVGRALADLATPGEAAAGPPDAARRLGFDPPLDEVNSYETRLTYREWLGMMADIRDSVAGRRTVVSKFDRVLPSAVYFFADLRAVLTVEPIMSIWTRDDLEAWKANLAARDFECLISTEQDDPMIDFVLASFGSFSTRRFAEPIPFAIHCRDARSAVSLGLLAPRQPQGEEGEDDDRGSQGHPQE